MKPSADRAAAEALRVRRVSGLTALAISYVLSFVATALMLAPVVGGGWGVMIAIGGGFIGLPFLGFAALVLLAFQRSVSHRPLACCIAAPPAIGAAWLILDYSFHYRSQHGYFPTYLAEVGSDPDKRNYIVSNKRLREAGFTAKRSLGEGIQELLKGYRLLGRSPFKNV